MRNLRIELLGPVCAWHGDEELDLGSARRRAVFAMLATRAGRIVSRQELIAGVWGQDAPATVEGSLYTYVSGLRRALDPARTLWSGGEVLVSVGAGYCLRVDPEALDVRVFAELRATATGHSDRGDFRAAADCLASALELWRGDALSGLAGPFAESTRAQHAELRVATREQLAEANLALGEHAEVVADLTGLVDEHPLREGVRGLLMLALHRSGRSADAMDSYRGARRMMIDELGIEPGPALRQLHDKILANDPSLTPNSTAIARTRAPAPVVPPAPSSFVGREVELAVLDARLRALASGRGGGVWIEGEPGIGKSGLVAAAMSTVDTSGTQVLWGAADELSARSPLRVLLDCLLVEPTSPDERRARLAESLRADAASVPHSWSTSDPVLAAVDRVRALVEQLCADGPVVIVVDDMHWGDDASLTLWQRLTQATARQPLLLVAASRPVPRRPEITRVREAVLGAGGDVLTLAPLADDEVTELVADVFGARPGAGLRALTTRAGGNPLYLREVLDALARDELVELDGDTAEVSDSAHALVPATMTAAIMRRLGFLAEPTTSVLRWAALLGGEFELGDLAVVVGKPVIDLVPILGEAIAAGVLTDAGPRFAFRHALVRDAIYATMPVGVRVALHRQVAQLLDAAGSDVERVAGQLLAAPTTVDPWVIEWLLANTTVIAGRIPTVTVELLTRAVASPALRGVARERLTARLARLQFWLGRRPEAEARAVLAMSDDANLIAEMRLILAYLVYARGDAEGAVEALRAVVTDDSVPQVWRARHQSLQAMIERCGLDDIEAAERTARGALTRASAECDARAQAHALQNLWQVESVERRHASALTFLDRALDAVRDNPDLTDLQLSLLDNRVFTLQNLDRLDEADHTLDLARDLLSRRGVPGGLHIPAAVNNYWLGRWDGAVAELDAVVQDGPEITFYGLRQRGAILLLHGAAALIAGHRDDTEELARHLAAADDFPLATTADKEHCDFLVEAMAVAALRDGRPEQALAVYLPILDRKYARMMLRHQWLPSVVRIALELGRTDVAHTAWEVCAAERDLEATPARAAAAAMWCQGLIENQPRLLLSVAEGFASAGRVLERAFVLEDAAVALAACGRLTPAQDAFDEAVLTYLEIGAAWDVRRAESRLGAHHIRRARYAEPATEHLSPSELRIAELVAAGWAVSDIAARLSLSDATVRTRMAGVLRKLGTGSRFGVTPNLVRRHAPDNVLAG